MSHFPALMMHILLLMLARLTINDYTDLFLVCTAVILTLHFIYAVISKKNDVLPGCAALLLYFLAVPLGIVTIDSGFMGLGGGGFGWLLYGAALAISLAAHCIVNLIRRLK